MDEIKVYEALGVERPEDAADAAEVEAGEQTPAAADAEEAAAGGAQETTEQKTPDTAEAGAGNDAPGGDSQDVSRVEREREIAAAEERGAARERERHQAEIAELFALAGLTDPGSGKPIRTLEEFNDWNRRTQFERMRQAMADGTITQEAFDAAVAAAMEGQKAEDAQSREAEAKRQRDADADARRQAEAEARIRADLAEIGKLDPNVKTLEDIMKSEKGPEIYRMVQAGVSIANAYRAANLERMLAQTAEAARRQTAAARQETAHISTGARQIGSGAVEVPTETRELYRELMPGISDAEISRHYNAQHAPGA